jgi:glycosyltransferase involved in cell wall biosynthesis
LYVVDTLEVGGTERSLLETAARLDRRFECVVCHLYRGDALRPQFESAGIRVVSLGLAGKYQFVRAFRRLRQLVLKERPDIIHTALFRADQVGRTIGWWLRIPTVSSFVGVPYDETKLTLMPLRLRRKHRLIRSLDRITAGWASHFHAVSKAAQQSNCQHLGITPSRVTVVARGRKVEPEVDAKDVSVLRCKLGLEDRYPVLLNVGRLSLQKGQQFAIQALVGIVQHYPQVKLLIAGDGPLESDLQTLITQLGLTAHVTLLGNRNDVPSLLRVADIFVFPSLYEGLPGSIIEAMQAGLPVIASDIPMMDGLVEHEVTGVLTPPKDVEALTRAVCRLAENPQLAMQLAARAREVAAAEFAIDRIVRQMEGLYDAVLTAAGKVSEGKRIK